MNRKAFKRSLGRRVITEQIERWPSGYYFNFTVYATYWFGRREFDYCYLRGEVEEVFGPYED